MNPIKKMIIEETAKVLKELKKENRIKALKANLYESVNAQGYLLKKAKNSKTIDEAKKNLRKYNAVKKLSETLESKIQGLREHELEGEGRMAKAQLLAVIEMAQNLYKIIDEDMQLEDWVQYKISIAENYIDAVYGYMRYFNGADDMEDNEMQQDMEDNDMDWDDVEEEDFDSDAEYFDDEDGDDFEDLDDFGFDDEDDYYDDDEEDFE